MKRRNVHSGHKAKSHLIYSSQDVQHLYGVCRNTLNNWIKRGLLVAGRGKQRYFRGSDLNTFHKNNAEVRKRTCARHEVHCVACKKIHQIKGLSFKAERIDAKLIRLHVTCPDRLKITCKVIRDADLSHIEQLAEPIRVRKQQAIQ